MQLQPDSSREELLALIGVLPTSPAAQEARADSLLVPLSARDERIDALLVTVRELTAQVQALVLRPGEGLLVVEAAVLGRPGPPPEGSVLLPVLGP